MSKSQSRAQRLEAALTKVTDAKCEIEELASELQSWLDNMPESLQGSAKADEIQEAIGSLESAVSSLEEAEGADVSFPGMFG